METKITFAPKINTLLRLRDMFANLKRNIDWKRVATNEIQQKISEIPVDLCGLQPVDSIRFSFCFVPPPLRGPQCFLHTTFGIDARFVESNNRRVNRRQVLFGKHTDHFGCRANLRCSKFSIQSATTQTPHRADKRILGIATGDKNKNVSDDSM